MYTYRTGPFVVLELYFRINTNEPMICFENYVQSLHTAKITALNSTAKCLKQPPGKSSMRPHAGKSVLTIQAMKRPVN